MATATWGLTPERSVSAIFGTRASTWWSSSSFYAPIFSHGCGPLDDDAETDLSSGAPPNLLRRLVWRHAVLIQTIEEISLLVLLGTLTNVLSFAIDHAIEMVTAERARASQEAGGFLPSYLVWFVRFVKGMLDEVTANKIELIDGGAEGLQPYYTPENLPAYYREGQRQCG